jgi:hypothetical protein
MSGGVCLTGLSYKHVPFRSRRFGLGFLSESLGFLRQPIRKGQRVLEMASLHGAAPHQLMDQYATTNRERSSKLNTRVIRLICVNSQHRRRTDELGHC